MRMIELDPHHLRPRVQSHQLIKRRYSKNISLINTLLHLSASHLILSFAWSICPFNARRKLISVWQHVEVFLWKNIQKMTSTSTGDQSIPVPSLADASEGSLHISADEEATSSANSDASSLDERQVLLTLLRGKVKTTSQRLCACSMPPFLSYCK